MKKEKTISGLVVEVGKKPKVIQLDNTLEAKQKVVGGYIEVVYPYDDPIAIICNEEGKLSGLPYNRVLTDESGKIYDIIAGTFFICGLAEDNFTSLSDDLINKYQKLFYFPEFFIPTKNGLSVIRINSDEEV